MPLNKHMRSTGTWVPELQSVILRATYNPAATGSPAGRQHEILKTLVSNHIKKFKRLVCVPFTL